MVATLVDGVDGTGNRNNNEKHDKKIKGELSKKKLVVQRKLALKEKLEQCAWGDGASGQSNPYSVVCFIQLPRYLFAAHSPLMLTLMSASAAIHRRLHTRRCLTSCQSLPSPSASARATFLCANASHPPASPYVPSHLATPKPPAPPFLLPPPPVINVQC